MHHVMFWLWSDEWAAAAAAGLAWLKDHGDWLELALPR